MATIPTTFGNWTINPEAATIEISPGGHGGVYQVPLDELDSSAAILDWLFQINEKTWASPADVGFLLQAIEELFGRGVAGSGVDRPFDPKPILERKLGCKF